MALTEASSQAAVEFHQVSSYVHRGNQTQKILNNITGRVPNGTILTLLGPSASGKSTLLALCNMLLTADEGEVFVQGKEVRQWAIPTLRRTVGMVFQTPTMLAGTVRDNLALGLHLRGDKLLNPEHYMEQVGLPADLLARDARELSGGQRQRVALARTLANDPQILLLDEITSALDPTAAREIEELIQDIHTTQRKTILWVTHDMDQARRVGELSWLIVQGQVVEASSTAALFDYPAQEVTRRFLQGDL